MKKIMMMSALFFATISVVCGQSKEKQLNELMEKYLNADQFSGVVLVAQNGKTIFEKSYGLADKEWNISNSTDAKFRIGSTTKQFTVAIILQLTEEGKIKLDGKIKDYIPEYPDTTGAKISIHQLLSHTSGIPNYTDAPDFWIKMGTRDQKPLDFIKEYWNKPLDFEPGTKWNYSNTGYFILGYIIEKVTGKSYKENLQTRIFTPLKMVNSGLEDNKSIIPKMANGYNYELIEWTRAEYVNLTTVYSAGAIYSTVDDLLKWENALWDGKVISKSSLAKMFSQYAPALGSYYGYGRMIGKHKFEGMKDSVTINEHGGSIPGFNSLLTTIPEMKTTIILLRNHRNKPLASIRTGIVDILNGQKPADIITDASAEFIKTFQKEGLTKAVAVYRQLKKENGKNISFSEDDLNTLGYLYLQKGKKDVAVSIFQLNTEYNPKSSNSWDSMGEAYYETGDFEKSKEAYQKSLELDAGNDNARMYLKQMGVAVAEKETVKVDQSVLNKYVGKYELFAGFIIAVTTEKDKIFIQATGQPQFEIFASSETEFFLKVVSAQITFVKDENGTFNALILHQGGRETKGKKVE